MLVFLGLTWCFSSIMNLFNAVNYGLRFRLHIHFSCGSPVKPQTSAHEIALDIDEYQPTLLCVITLESINQKERLQPVLLDSDITTMRN